MDNFSLKTIAIMPIRAGADVLLFSDLRSGKESVKTDGMLEELIDTAVLKIIKLKQRASETD